MTDKKTQISINDQARQISYLQYNSGLEASFQEWETFLYKDSKLDKDAEAQAFGYGVERCLYELNPELACISPFLIHAQVFTPAAALLALEDVAIQPNRPAFPVDRHLAAFLISRWKQLSFIDLRDMNKPQREVRNMAVLKIFASIQSHFKLKALPNLCQWMADLCVPVVTHYHNLKVQVKVREEITKAVSSGQLMNLVQVFTNRQALVSDKCDYQAAKIEILLIESEIKEIELRILNRNSPASRSKKGIRYTLSFPFVWLLSSYRSRKAQKQITKLFRRSEVLRETWGEGLLPRGKNATQDFWSKLWVKMNVSRPLSANNRVS